MKTVIRLLAPASCMLLLATGAFAQASSTGSGQAYPTCHIELVSATDAGGGSDLVARMVADIVAKDKLLLQQVIVQNRLGGGCTAGQGSSCGGALVN